MNVFLIILCIFLAITTITAIWITYKTNREFEKIDKEIKDEEKKKNDIITNANNTKAEVRTGDHERDFNNIANKLHEFASK